MALAQLVLWSGIFWTLIHLTLSFFRSRQEKQSNLPLTTTPNPSTLRHRRCVPVSFSEISINARDVRLDISTTFINASFDRLSFNLQRPGFLQQAICLFYNLGAIVSTILNLLSPFAILLLLSSLLSQASIAEMPADARLSILKRSAEPPPTTQPQTQFQHLFLPSFVLLVPGVNLPLSHLPIIMMAAFLSLLVHEAGHAIPAALDRVSLTSAGVSLYWVIPSASIALSTSSLRALSSWSRVRIVAGGAWHNLVLWAALWSCGGSYAVLLGAKALLSPAYRNFDGIGRVVMSINPGSPLDKALPIGAVITSINEHPTPLQILWDNILLSVEHHQVSSGWCISRDWLSEQSSSCCFHVANISSTLSCFEANFHQQYCLDPSFVLKSNPVGWVPSPPVPSHPSASRAEDCTSIKICPESSICMWPRIDQDLFTLKYIDPYDNETHTLIWKGPANEIWHQVSVGSWWPRIRMVPPSLPALASLFFRYMAMITISIGLLNLAPAPYLDGSDLLEMSLATVERKFRNIINGTYGVQGRTVPPLHRDSLARNSFPSRGEPGAWRWHLILSRAIGWTSATLLASLLLISLTKYQASSSTIPF